MIRVYMNYPISNISIHGDPSCPHIMQGHKKNQRLVRVNEINSDAILKRFRQKDYRFNATSDFNDMWLEIGLSSRKDESSFVASVKRELSRYYKPFRDAEMSEHC